MCALELQCLLILEDYTTRRIVLLSTNATSMSEHEQKVCEPLRLGLWKLPCKLGLLGRGLGF